MKVAIPIYNNRISPRFDCAYRFMIVTAENGEIKEKDSIIMNSMNLIQRINEFANMGIDTLICGAISEFTFRMITDKKINVIPWIIGEADKVLDLFLKGKLEPGMNFFPDGRRICRKGHFGRGFGKGRGLGRRSNKKK